MQDVMERVPACGFARAGQASRFAVYLFIFCLIFFPVSMALALTNNISLTPPMGWNSWNNYGCNINETLIKRTADAMATNGMKAAGFQFINLDDCWQTSRDATGAIVADPAKFPSGIKALADYVHSKGLKLGLYSDHGLQTCGGRPGGYGYEYLDANTYASWGVDYLKYDNCNLPNGDVPQTDYLHMSDALMKSGRPLTFSICAWTFDSWDSDLGNLWRTTGDISDSFASMTSKLAPNSQSAYVAGPGRWNDPDMLEVGRGGMTTTEDQAHFTLWCIMAAPLIAGNSLTNMSAQTLATLTNPEVIAVDQDPAGEQGIQVAGSSANQTWCKPLGSDFTTKAVALFNNDTNPAIMTVNWTNLGVQAGSATVRDLWARTDLGTFTNSFTTNVPAHAAVLLKVVGTAPTLPAVGTNYLSDLQAAYTYVGWGTMTKDESIGGTNLTLNGTTYSKGLGVHAFSGAEYRLGAIASRFFADIGVDDEVGAGKGSVVFQVFADGLKIYDSGVLHCGDAHQSINLDVTGVNRLTLGVHDADDNINYDHSDWAGARVTVVSTTPASPPAPSGLAGTPGNPIALSWNTTRSATNYNVKRALTLGGPYTNIANVSSNRFADAAVVAATTYYYAISASDVFGESTNSSPIGVTACTPPVAPPNLTVVASGAQISLGWNAVSGANGYVVARATSATPFSTIASGLSSTVFVDTNVLQGMTYFYIVAASNSCNQGPFSSIVSGTTVPVAPMGLIATAAGAQVVLNWTAAAYTSGFNIKRALTTNGPFASVAGNVSSPPYVDTAVNAGTTYYYVVSALNAAGESPNSAPAGATPCAGALPVGWTDQDIGSVGFTGTASVCSASFVLKGGGADIWGSADAFQFASVSFTGDSTIVVRVTAMQNTDPWAKAGVMFRNDTTAGSMFADAFVSVGNGVYLQWRTTTGGPCGSTGVGGVVAPVWVRLTRTGTNFYAYYSSDGISWTALGSVGIAMSGIVRAGLEVTAHNNSALCTAAFDKVATSSASAPTGLTGFGGDRWVSLNWAADPTAAGYNIKRGTAHSGPYTTVGTPSSNSYFDSPLSNWVTYYYVVSTINGIGESANSSEIAITPRPPPTLNASSSNGQLTLSWPAWATGYSTFSATNLIAPVQWQPITNAPQSGANEFSLPLLPGRDKQFFRLSAP